MSSVPDWPEQKELVHTLPEVVFLKVKAHTCVHVHIAYTFLKVLQTVHSPVRLMETQNGLFHLGRVHKWGGVWNPVEDAVRSFSPGNGIPAPQLVLTFLEHSAVSRNFITEIALPKSGMQPKLFSSEVPMSQEDVLPF